MEGLLGGGSYGVVAKVHKAGRYYAMKVYSDTYLQQKGHQSCLAIDLFQRETWIMQSIRHPEIPGYVDSFSYEAMYCLVQDYIHGDTLATLMNLGYCCQEKEVKNLLCKLLTLVNFLHQPKDKKPALVHRDLRLSNIMLDKQRLFIIDFGLAYPLHHIAGESFLMKRPPAKTGTDVSPSYLSMRNDYSVQCDLFGAGVVTVDLFTNAADSDESLHWEQRISVSKPFKTLIRRLLGVKGEFSSCLDALEHLRAIHE